MKLKSFLVLLGTLILTALAVACWFLVYNNDTIVVCGHQFSFTVKQVENISIVTGVIFLLHFYFNLKNTTTWIDGSLLFLGTFTACTISVFQVINIILEDHQPITSKLASLFFALVIVLIVAAFATTPKENIHRL